MALRSAGVKGFFYNAAGKLVGKNGFLSAAKIAKFKSILSQRAKRLRGPKGFTTPKKAAAYQAKVRKAEKEFRTRWKAPPGNLTWVQLITKYPGQFEDYIPEFDRIMK